MQLKPKKLPKYPQNLENYRNDPETLKNFDIPLKLTNDQNTSLNLKITKIPPKPSKNTRIPLKPKK